VSVSAAGARALALALPEATEQPHHDLTSFRVRGKIFATMPLEGGGLHVFLPDDQVASYCVEFPGAVEELWWGKQLRGCRIVLKHANRTLVRELLSESWRRRAPKSLGTD
jgi:hypothetical protein